MVMGKKIIMKDTEREIIFVFHNNKVYILLSRGTEATFPDKDRREKVRQETGGGNNNNFLIAEKRWD